MSPREGLASKISDEMKDILRDSEFGRLVRLATRNKYLKYPEEVSTFKCPNGYDDDHLKSQEAAQNSATPQSISATDGSAFDAPEYPAALDTKKEGIISDAENGDSIDLEQAHSSHSPPERIMSRPIMPMKSSDGTLLVDWYMTGMLLEIASRVPFTDACKMILKTLTTGALRRNCSFLSKFGGAVL